MISLRSICDFMETFKDYLSETLSDYGIEAKSEEDPESSNYNTIPEIYLWAVPSQGAGGKKFPWHSPSIVIMREAIEGGNENTFRITCGISVSMPSTSNAEQMVPVEDTFNRFTKSTTTTGYTNICDQDLLKLSDMWTTKVRQAIAKAPFTKADNRIDVYVDSSLSAYPWAMSTVSFDIVVNPMMIGECAFSDLY